MQEKEQKVSPIKQRILEFAENLGISKRKFYNTIGVSRGTLESPTGITEDILSKFIAAFPNVNIVWLITGKEVKDANPKDGNLYNQQLLDNAPLAVVYCCQTTEREETTWKRALFLKNSAKTTA